jgi:hypothetical protein
VSERPACRYAPSGYKHLFGFMRRSFMHVIIHYSRGRWPITGWWHIRICRRACCMKSR